MPYSLGAMDAPTNPNQLPNSYPFKLVINSELARLEQSLDKNLEDILEKTYLIGMKWELHPTILSLEFHMLMIF